MKYILNEPVCGKTGTDHYQCTIKWRAGEFITDESLPCGGKDLGPDPFTLLLASLASCTLATLRMYIDRKGWLIDQIEVSTNLFQTAKDGICTSTIEREIRLPNGVLDEKRDRLLEIASKCPISKLLEGHIKIRSYLFNEGGD